MIKRQTAFLFILLTFFSVSSCTEKEKIFDRCDNTYCFEGVCVDGICECDEGYMGENCDFYDPAKVQFLLDSGLSPKELLNAYIDMDSLYGKHYKGGLIFEIFQVPDSPDDGKVLIAALESLPATQWGCNGTNISDLVDVPIDTTNFQPDIIFGLEMWKGAANTYRILQECTEDGAAMKSKTLGPEWFLPSIDELGKMYYTLHERGYGNFPIGTHWSSTEVDSTHAWARYYFNLFPEAKYKFMEGYVRPVRSVD